MKLRRTLSPVLLAAYLTLILRAATLHAGPILFDSVESTMCEASLVVLGTLSQIKAAEPLEGRAQWDCLMTVSELIKGNGQSPVTFRVWSEAKPDWAVPGKELLIFLKPALPPRGQAQPGQAQVEPFSYLRVIDPAKLNHLTSCEMRVVQDREDLLHICRVWSKSPLQRSVSFPIPDESELGAEHGGHGVRMLVPAEEKLRLQLIDEARSPKPGQRTLAAKLLVSFPGPETEAVLTRLLEDPAANYTLWGDDTPWFAEYPVRVEACKSLDALGKTVPQVVVRGKVNAEEQSRFRKDYWSKSLFNILPAAWRVESVEEGPSQPVKDERGALVVVRVKCADAGNSCTFTLVPVEWNGEEPWKKAKLLGRMSGGGYGRRIFYVEGQAAQGKLSGAWETRIIEAFKLEPVEP